MKRKKIPSRMCIGCREKKEKRELLRIVRTPDREVLIDETGKKSGRGAYICKNIKCLEKAIKSKVIEKTLETSLSDDMIQDLKTKVDNYEK